MAKVSQRAENAYVGVSCGIMDQFTVTAAREGAALLLDCRSLEVLPVSLPAGAVVVIMDTGSRRGARGERLQRAPVFVRCGCSRAAHAAPGASRSA